MLRNVLLHFMCFLIIAKTNSLLQSRGRFGSFCTFHALDLTQLQYCRPLLGISTAFPQHPATFLSSERAQERKSKKKNIELSSFRIPLRLRSVRNLFLFRFVPFPQFIQVPLVVLLLFFKDSSVALLQHHHTLC